jgi:chromosome segregation ATPase
MLCCAVAREELLKKQHVMAQAVEDAELAVSVLQRKLAESEQARCDAQKQVIDVRRSADTLRGNLEQQLRTATQDGHLRIRLLEETIEKLSRRGDQAAEVARLSAEASQLRRSEAHMRSDLTFAQSRSEALAREVEALSIAASAQEACASKTEADRVRGVIAQTGADSATALAMLSDLDAHRHEQASQQELLAKLVERAEKAEVELGRAHAEVASLKDKLRTSTGVQSRGITAVTSASQVRSCSKFVISQIMCGAQSRDAKCYISPRHTSSVCQTASKMAPAPSTLMECVIFIMDLHGGYSKGHFALICLISI